MPDRFKKNFFFLACSLVLLIGSAASFSLAVELLPLPSWKEDRFERQQQAPRYAPSQDAPERMRFKQDLRGFSCQQLKELRHQLQNQHDSSRTEADRAYYRRFLEETHQAINDKKCDE